MANINIFTKRSNLISDCNNTETYQVELTNSKYLEKAQKSDTLKFKRVGVGLNNGFKVSFDPALANGADFDVVGSDSLDIPIASTQPNGEFKYTVEYPNEPAGTVVLPLDPVIIIQGSGISRLVKRVICGAVGFLLGLGSAWYFL